MKSVEIGRSAPNGKPGITFPVCRRGRASAQRGLHANVWSLLYEDETPIMPPAQFTPSELKTYSLRDGTFTTSCWQTRPEVKRSYRAQAISAVGETDNILR